MIKVDGRRFADALVPYPGTIEVSVAGYLADGQTFAGSDLVKIVN